MLNYVFNVKVLTPSIQELFKQLSTTDDIPYDENQGCTTFKEIRQIS